jgi:hypothetical protein
LSYKHVLKEQAKRKLAAEALLSARYLLIEARAILEDECKVPTWCTRQKQLDKEIERVLDSVAGLGNA